MDESDIQDRRRQSEDIPLRMRGVLLTGHGGFDKLQIRDDIPVPAIRDDEVLIRVSAAGINNTDINTRIGWYSKVIDSDTHAGGSNGFEKVNEEDASWAGVPLSFPRIQGADCCGHIVAVGNSVNPDRVGERVIVRTMLRSYSANKPMACWTFGSECNGAFAEYTKISYTEAYKIECDWSDVELASIPCAYSTAEGMLHRAHVTVGERVLILGATGGVGSAAVQLTKRRGAEVIAVAGSAKAEKTLEIGADHVIPRGHSLVENLGYDSIDVVIDVVAGTSFREALDVLKRGGRYVVAGAIGGPIVELDVRTLYLKDLTFFGCTYQEDIVFQNLVSYIERGEIRPNIGRTYPLQKIVRAQEDFLSKTIFGKLVLTVS